MGRLVGVVVFATIAVSGCVSSDSVVCPVTGIICPADASCRPTTDGGERCVRPVQVEACNGIDEGSDCDYEGLPGACRDGVCEAYFCGDGFITNGESCDGDNIGDLTCAKLGYYGPEKPTCRTNCTLEVDVACGAGGKCGDDIINGPELCDGPATKSCVSIGFDAGSVHCDELCGFTIMDCSKFGWSSESLDMVALGFGASSLDQQWAVGTGGKIAKFDGVFWTPEESGVTNDLKAVWAQKPYAWAAGLPQTNPSTPGVVLFWDGTAVVPAWQAMTNPPAATYNDIWAIDPMAVYLATKEVGVQVYNGTTWSKLGNLTGEVFTIRGTTPSDLWATTDLGLQHWNGTDWTLAPLTDTRIRFIDANAIDDVWAAGEARSDVGTGVIAHWDGMAWQTRRTSQEIYNGITSSAPNDAWLVIAGGELRHFDGNAWTAATTIGERPDGTSTISAIHSITANHVVAVSTLRVAYRYRGLTFGKQPEMRLHPTSNPWNSPTNTSVWSDAANDMYVTNVKGEVLKFDGLRWTSMFDVDPLADSSATAMFGIQRNNLFVGTQFGSVFRYNGMTWTEFKLTPQIAIDTIVGTSPQDVWAFGAGGAFKWNGTMWMRSELSGHKVLSAAGAGSEFYAIELVAPLNKLWRFTAGSWRQVTDTGTTTRFSAVTVVDDTHVHVAAENGHLLEFDGTGWKDHAVPAVTELRYLASTGPRDVIAASERELFSFDGEQWSPMRTPIDFVPNTPDYFPIVGLAASPGRVDILLERWRVRTLIRTRPLFCELAEDDGCDDGVDNNCDGFIDSTDAMCQ